MADRFFPNEMPDFVPETPAEEQSAFETSGDSLTKLLSLPFNTVADTLKRAALDAKETVKSPSPLLYSKFCLV
ncbi:hypothetical protein RHMOL_Rhmol04G0035800 [Rhododendron molle]|uniref:Uncharacterized protein n=1 Tax=Rhododendron molle TaxID=49168 RepID=A0ACC0NZ17_RHOML|nr:hypothetical protein RHMOL_Rhmol04G0035800 [Rhododendron molle]